MGRSGTRDAAFCAVLHSRAFEISVTYDAGKEELLTLDQVLARGLSTGKRVVMDTTVLHWRRFESFLKAQEAFRQEFEFKGKRRSSGTPSIYLLTDKEERVVLRVGETGEGLLEEYKTGVRNLIEAALHGSGNRVFVAPAPADHYERQSIERTLIRKYDPPFNPQKREPSRQVDIEHSGDVPMVFAVVAADKPQLT